MNSAGWYKFLAAACKITAALLLLATQAGVASEATLCWLQSSSVHDREAENHE